jgi:sigma-B regulation protein RsbU (phosphoserine phosphatase)
VANRAAISVLGVPVDEQGQPCWPARLLFGRRGVDGRDGAADRVAPVQPLERAIAGEDVPESTYTLQVPYATAPREVSVSGHPVVDESGALHGGMLVIRDVTERLALQKKAVAMELAGALQQRQFPKAPPQGLDLDLAGTVRAAEETSGDGYDWMLAPDGRLVLSVTDVRDHGLRAAMQMVSARAYLRSQVAAGSAPDRALAQVNASLVAELAPEDFVTLLCVEVDPATRRVRYANAGHPEGLVLGPDGSVEARLEATGPLLGVMERARYRLAEAPPLLPGRTLVLLTDGVLECADRRGRRFEEARLLQVLERHARRRAQDIVEAVLAAVRDFAGEGPPQDDLTVVVLKG